MPQLTHISLSQNDLTRLEPFSNCYELKELYLRKNQISNLSEVKYLENLPNLRVLWLDGNPCCSHPNYRAVILKLLPNLDKIDTNAVTTVERMKAKNLDMS